MVLELVAQPRTQFGREVKQVRANGLIPAELYGYGVKNEHLSVKVKEFNQLFKKAGESTLIDLTVNGVKHPVLIHDVKLHPLTEDVLSIDFYQVRLDQPIKVNVPVVFIGEAPGVKEKGGVLVKSLSEIEIEALPADLPHELTVNLAKLVDIGSSFHVKELVVPSGVEILDDEDFVIVTITARMTEEQEAALSAESDVSSIKTEGEEKKEEKVAGAEVADGAETPSA